MTTAILRGLVLGLAFTRGVASARSRLRLALSFLAIVSVVAGIVFLVAAGYMFAVILVGPHYGALVVGGILLLKGLLWMTVARHIGTA